MFNGNMIAGRVFGRRQPIASCLCKALLVFQQKPVPAMALHPACVFYINCLGFITVWAGVWACRHGCSRHIDALSSGAQHWDVEVTNVIGMPPAMPNTTTSFCRGSYHRNMHHPSRKTACSLCPFPSPMYVPPVGRRASGGRSTRTTRKNGRTLTSRRRRRQRRDPAAAAMRRLMAERQRVDEGEGPEGAGVACLGQTWTTSWKTISS